MVKLSQIEEYKKPPVLYTHLVITRFLYRSAGLNERQSLPKSQGRSTLVASVPKWEWPTQRL